MSKNINNILHSLRAEFRRIKDVRHLKALLFTFILRRVIKKPIVFPDRNGFQFIIHPEEHIYSLFYRGYLGYPEIGEQEYCKKILRPGMTVFDVGANIGQFTMLFASLVAPAGKVYAFEPCTDTIGRLKANILLNGLKNVVFEQAAVYDIHGAQMKFNIF